MRLVSVPLLLCLLLAACSSAPPRRVAGGTGSGGTLNDGARRARPIPTLVDHSVGQEEISIQAMSLVGVPYRWGGNSPSGGFDCSGLVHYVLRRAADVDLPRTTADMSHSGRPIAPDEVAPGDLVFFNTNGRPHSHVGIYVGDYRFVNAPSTGGSVRLDSIASPYWGAHFDGIRRVTAGRAVEPRPSMASAVVPPAAPAPITPVAEPGGAMHTPLGVTQEPDPIAAFADSPF